MKFTASTRITRNGNQDWLLPIHAALYKGFGGMIFGEGLILQNEPADSADITGNLGWLRPADAKAKVFPLGFLKEVVAMGEKYSFTKTTSLLSGSSTTASFTQTIAPVGGVQISQGGTWPSSNTPMLTVPVLPGLKLSFAGKTGVFKGTVPVMVNGKAIGIPYEGVILSKPLTLPGGTNPVRGAGFMSKDASLGSIEISVP